MPFGIPRPATFDLEGAYANEALVVGSPETVRAYVQRYAADARQLLRRIVSLGRSDPRGSLSVPPTLRERRHAVDRMTDFDTIIVGGGQSGLAMSYWLKQAGRDHVVLERGRIAERWQSERWDSLCILTPNWSVSLPNTPYAGPEPDAFMGKDEVTAFITSFATRNDAPVRTGVNVERLAGADGGGYRLDTSEGPFTANNVVVATGAYGIASVPPLGRALPPEIVQVHSQRYRNPSQLPPGAVLVIGSGSSGFQIVEDLLDDDRRVFFSIGRHETRVRRYRGKDTAYWMDQLGQWERKIEDAPQAYYAPRAALTGAKGGHDLNLRKLAHDGVTLIGRIQAVDGHNLRIAADVHEKVRQADESARRAISAIDEYIAKNGIDAPLETIPTLPDPPELADPITELNLRDAGITSVVWGTGFHYDFGWIDIPVIGSDGDPIHRRGITASPGLYFLGLRFLYKFKSSFIHGVGEDAVFLAEHIAKG